MTVPAGLTDPLNVIGVPGGTPLFSEKSTVNAGVAATAARVKVWMLVQPPLSVTFTLNVNDPAVLGIPESVPDEESVSHGGDVPLKANEKGAVPPDAANVCEYGEFTVAFGRAAGVRLMVPHVEPTVSV
jgi:hypothetical protein